MTHAPEWSCTLPRYGALVIPITAIILDRIWYIGASPVTNGTHPAIPDNILYYLSMHQDFDVVIIDVVGIAELDVLDGIEVAVVDAKEPEEIHSAVVIYVVVGLAAGGGCL